MSLCYRAILWGESSYSKYKLSTFSRFYKAQYVYASDFEIEELECFLRFNFK